MALGALQGMDVVVVHPPMPKRRTWRERLFSRPWRPFTAYKMVEHPMWAKLGDTTCYRVGNVLYVSPQQFDVLESTLGALPAMRARPPGADVFRWK